MLERLYVENIALIDKLEVSFGGGLNVLSGETGAGKSILIDSLNLALGERADRELISSGSSRALVHAFFDVAQNGKVLAVLDKYGIENEDRLMLTRELSADGKNVCRINGRPVSLNVLRELTQYLVDIYGQHEHQTLLDSQNHLAFLDNYAGRELGTLKEQVAEAFKEWSEAKARLQKKFLSEEERARTLELLNYQINEIDNAALKPDEEEKLRSERTVLLNAQKIADTLIKVNNRLFDGTEKSKPASEMLRRSAASMQSLAQYGEEYNAIAQQIDDVYYALEEIRLSMQSAEVDDDPARMDEIEERLESINALKRKYGKTYEEINAYAQRCRDELDEIIRSTDEYAQNQSKERQAREKLLALSKELSAKRKECARRFEEVLKDQLVQVGMKNVSFEVSFAEWNDENAVLSEEGADCVEFLFSANLGQEVKPLAKIISGGELSRFMLAVKSITADIDHIPTMIFDEIDTGISGKMAQMIAEKIARIAKVRQILCITHLPQIAAMSDEHYLIEKSVEENKTRTRVYPLDKEGKLAEIARLAAAEADDETGRAHAARIVELSDEYKNNITF